MVASPAAAPSPRHLTVPGDTDSSSSSSNDARLTATPSRTPTPSHQLPLSTSRESAYLQSIFIGLAFASSPAKSGTDGHDDLRFFLSVSEGFAIQATEQGRLDDVDLREGQGGAEQAVRTIVEKLRQFAASQSYKVGHPPRRRRPDGVRLARPCAAPPLPILADAPSRPSPDPTRRRGRARPSDVLPQPGAAPPAHALGQARRAQQLIPFPTRRT